MELDDLIKGTMKVFNCCDRKATAIVARYLNESKKIELENKIKHGGGCNDTNI